jgi:hypothetical protein
LLLYGTRFVEAVVHLPPIIRRSLTRTYHVHGDHPFALRKYSAGQLSTLADFESADPGLDDQFSTDANSTVNAGGDDISHLRPSISTLCVLSEKRNRAINPYSYSLNSQNEPFHWK